MRFAFADPPYVGQSRKLYGGAEVNHPLLVEHLVSDYPDGWALSCSSPSLRELLPLCPTDVRVMAWVKPFAIFKPGVGVAYAWEPVIVRGGRRRTREQATVFDWTKAGIVQRGFTGAKPDGFCAWLFEVLNIEDGDELHDLFPGTGAVTKSLEAWRRQQPLTEPHRPTKPHETRMWPNPGTRRYIERVQGLRPADGGGA